MPEFLTQFFHSPEGRQAIASMVAIALALGVRFFVVRWIRKNPHLDVQGRLRWHGHARSLMLTVLALGLIFVWGSELREFLVSLVVLASALVLATKELLMCVSGSLLRATTRSFDVGDRIEVDGIRGDVIALGLLGTTLLEIGPGHQRTGRTQVIPNSLFLTKSVANETFTQQYVLHTFSVPVRGAEWDDAEARLLDIANRACADHIEAARTHMDATSTRHGLSGFDIVPRATVQLESADEVWLRLRIPTPARERGRIEQEIVRQYLKRESREDV